MTHKNPIRAAALLLLTVLAGDALAGATFDKVRESGHLRLGYLPQARPFSSQGANGAAEGYGIALCQDIADHVKAQLALPQLVVEWVPVTPDTRYTLVMRGDVDVLCTPTSATLDRRKAVSFSLPVFAGGVRAVVRNNAPQTLKDILSATPAQRNVWRGSPARALVEKTSFATVASTTSERWLASKVYSFKLNTATVSVPDYASGVRYLQEGKIDVLFAERDAALAAMDDAARKNLVVLDRQFTHEPLSLAVPRGDDDFRLFVDSVLANVYNGADFPALYAKYFGVLDDGGRTFFSWVTPPP